MASDYTSPPKSRVFLKKYFIYTQKKTVLPIFRILLANIFNIIVVVGRYFKAHEPGCLGNLFF